MDSRRRTEDGDPGRVGPEPPRRPWDRFPCWRPSPDNLPTPLGFALVDVHHRQAPDRNLALELVRVTEAAALAATRWMGRGDKDGADGAAVDAMRILLTIADGWGRGHRRGREGRRADAVQRRAHRRRMPPQDRHRGRPDRRDHPRPRSGAAVRCR